MIRTRRALLSFLLLLAAPAAPQPLSPAFLDSLFDGVHARRPIAVVSSRKDDGLEGWLVSEKKVALARMLANISPPGAAPGAVAASPSRHDPDYWFNWKRDAALTMSEVVALYRASTGEQKRAYLKMLTDYAAFARRAQTAPSQAGVGEPKSNMDGTVFTGPWGRPQDDGPAEEASTLIALARDLLSSGDKEGALALYGDFTSGIKGDLEYVSHRWKETSFDVWEEVKARHFDTLMAQRSALLSGAGLARTLGDPKAGNWYEAQAAAIAGELGSYWDAEKGYLVCARDRDGGLDYKASGLDSAVILAAIHSDQGAGGAFSATDPRVLATAQALKEAFKAAYSVNRRQDAPGVAIGRYPEDRYFGGNPWVLNTNAFAELYYKAALDFSRAGEIAVTNEDLAFFHDLVPEVRSTMSVSRGDPMYARLLSALKEGGDGYLRVVRAHANADGSLSEQIDKDSGYMRSAADLTWNYASFLSAVRAREALAAASGPRAAVSSTAALP